VEEGEQAKPFTAKDAKGAKEKQKHVTETEKAKENLPLIYADSR
jgi:hypothetical protein